MYHRMLASIGRVLYYCALPILHVLPRQPRVRGLLIDTNQRVLLVRNWFGSQDWELPGGGVKHNESSEQALVRELREETSLIITVNQLYFVHTYTTNRRIAPLRLAFYTATLPPAQLVQHRNREIFEVNWFSVNNLPPDCDQTVHDTLKIVFKQI